MSIDLDYFDAAIRDLDSPERAVRLDAVKRLGSLGDVRALPVLAQLLDAKEVPMRVQAVRGLGRLTDPEALRALGKALQSDHAVVRRQAMKILARKARPEWVPGFMRMLADPDPEVTEIAARALEGLRDRRAVPALMALADDPVRTGPDSGRRTFGAFANARTAAIRALGVLGDPQAIPTIVRALDRGELRPGQWILDSTAMIALQSFGEAAGPALVEALGSDAPAVRSVALMVLTPLHSFDAVSAVIPLLQSPGMQESAARYLERHLDPIAIPALMRMLQNEDRKIRTEAAEALRQLGDTSVISTIVTLLQQQPLHSAELVLALGHLGDRSAIPAIGEAIRRALMSSAEWAESQGIQTDAAPSFLSLTERVYMQEYGIAALGKLQAVPELLSYIQHEQTRIRLHAVQALGETGAQEEAVIHALKAARRDPERSVRTAAAKALEKWKVWQGKGAS